MSGIYIPRVENLKCNDCFWAIGYRLKCSCSAEQSYYDTGERPKDCPLISVPDHGRLGDLDAVFMRLQKQAMALYGRDTPRYLLAMGILDAIRFTPTVIPEDKEEAE